MSMFVFISFAHIMGYIVSFLPGKLNVPFGRLHGIPFVLYSLLLGSILWGIIVFIAWFIKNNKMAFGLLGMIIFVITVLHFITSKKLAKLFELAHKELEKMENLDKQKTE